MSCQKGGRINIRGIFAALARRQMTASSLSCSCNQLRLTHLLGCAMMASRPKGSASTGSSCTGSSCLGASSCCCSFLTHPCLHGRINQLCMMSSLLALYVTKHIHPWKMLLVQLAYAAVHDQGQRHQAEQDALLKLNCHRGTSQQISMHSQACRSNIIA